MMRSLEQLLDTDDPGIALLRQWADQPSANRHELLAPDLEGRGAALERYQVTTRSMLGAMIYETGGMLINLVRLRVFGSGQARSILRANAAIVAADQSTQDVILVADDIAGGIFALNGGRFGSDNMAEIFHLPADDSAWSPMEVGYTDFISWCLTGDLSMVYDFSSESRAFSADPPVVIDKVKSFFPFLWTKEGRHGQGDLRLVDADEYLKFRLDLIGFTVAE